MIFKIVVVICGLLVLLTTFRSKWILNKIAKIEKPSDRQELLLKLSALAAAVILLIIVHVFEFVHLLK